MQISTDKWHSASYSAQAYVGCSSPSFRPISPQLGIQQSVMYDLCDTRPIDTILALEYHRSLPVQITLLGNRGTCVWTTCPQSPHEETELNHQPLQRESNILNTTPPFPWKWQCILKCTHYSTKYSALEQLRFCTHCCILLLLLLLILLSLLMLLKYYTAMW